ncbi:cilia- and flagella-associated protein 36 isoform X1 [Atheta coriaria]|uniref:cilia- and flagella-associated protein 36 isoform X1 n=1 Tax=Dalotia coriaria TaxID=877792 RepID=UPI0031F3DBE9
MSEEDSWVFDSLVCFLNGPIWNAPLQSFIEERSLIFDPHEPADDEEHRKTFDDFKNLVDFMLGNFMEDIGITSAQFEHACFRGAKERVPLQFDQNTFEQIWAANDYEMFKRMMTQRNVELQLQALELIERKFGRTPESFIPQKREEVARNTAQVSPMLKSSELEREVLVEVSKQFPIAIEGEEEQQQEDEIKYLIEEKHNLEETLKVAIEEKLSSQKQFLEHKSEDDEVEDAKESIEEDQPKPPAKLTSIATRIPIDRPQNSNVDSIEVKKRQEYLRAQRDKLIALKKEVRKKHLDEDQASSVEKARVRPKSAKAAESVLKFGAAPSMAESERLKLRKALVQRLKSEVVNQPE